MLEQLYRRMRTIRTFEDRVVTLVNTGEIPGATHEYSGEEAVAVGVCAELRESDVITSTHRGHGHLIAKGVKAGSMMAELMGRQAGLNSGRGGSMHATDLARGSSVRTASSPRARRSPRERHGRPRPPAPTKSRSRSLVTTASTRACSPRRST